jgi:hypothetical protein
MRAIKITRTRLNQMKSVIKLSDLMRYKCPDLQEYDRNKYCICPFHNEKTASMCVNDDLEHYHCFGCGESGDHISFLYAVHFKGDKRHKPYWGDHAHFGEDDMSIYKVMPRKPKLKSFMQCVRLLSQITGITIK